MPATAVDLEESVPEGARRTARALLATAAAAVAALQRGDDPEALHDFRVAIRRLRSWERAFRPELGQVIRKRDRARLRALGQLTGPGRDLEVQLEWLGEAESRLGPRGVEGVGLMRERLTASAPGGDDAAVAVAASFTTAHDPLVGRLDRVASVGAHAPTLAAAIAIRLRGHARDLGTALDAVHSIADQEQAHAARIRGKRLRYLLEPAADGVADGRRTLGVLRRLQDDLGAMHDAHVMLGAVDAALDAGAPASRLRPVRRLADRAMRQHFRAIERRWLAGRHARFVERIDRIALRLERLG